MVVSSDGVVLSDIELVLPCQVIAECQSLDRNARSYFIAVNKLNLTSTQLTMHKLEDDSVQLRVTVLALGSHVGELTPEQKSRETKLVNTVVDICHNENNDDMSVSNDHGVNLIEDKEPINSNDHDEINAANKRKSFKGRPRIANAVDSSRLNKHLTAVWGSKRKKSSKKVIALDVSSTDGIVTTKSNESENRSAYDEGSGQMDKEEVQTESMASTVIILKTVSRQSNVDVSQWTHNDAQWTSDNGNIVDIEMEFVDEAPAIVPPPTASKASRDIAERLKARKRRFTELNNEVNSEATSHVSCELCGELVPGYAQLVKHVHRQHEDCTFVRNYLDEIKPLAAALSAISLPCSECGRMFSGQTALSSHKYECHSMARPETKLGTLRRYVKAAAANKTDRSVDEDGSNRLSCKNCYKKFKSLNKLHKHEMTHSDTNDVTEPVPPPVHECKHCGKEFPARDNLMKHIKRIHGSQQKNDEKMKKSASESNKASTRKNSLQNVSESSDGDSSKDLQEFACNHCKTVFGRMSLLVTHMRYCVKANNVKN